MRPTEASIEEQSESLSSSEEQEASEKKGEGSKHEEKGKSTPPLVNIDIVELLTPPLTPALNVVDEKHQDGSSEESSETDSLLDEPVEKVKKIRGITVTADDSDGDLMHAGKLEKRPSYAAALLQAVEEATGVPDQHLDTPVDDQAIKKKIEMQTDASLDEGELRMFSRNQKLSARSTSKLGAENTHANEPQAEDDLQASMESPIIRAKLRKTGSIFSDELVTVLIFAYAFGLH